MAATATRHERTLGSARLREALVGYAFIAVPMGIFLTFFIYPLVYSLYISRYDWGVFGKIETLGWENYRGLWHDEFFWRAMKNTVLYTLVVVPAEMALALTLAVIVNAGLRGRAFFRSAFYFPSLASSAAITAIAIYILSADGLLNAVIGGQRAWFGDSDTALWAIAGLNVWTTSGTLMLFYLAALQAIPTDVYEAAAMDGAKTWRMFWKITFPLLEAGPLLRRGRLRDRSAADVRPVVHRLERLRRPELLDPLRGALPLPDRDRGRAVRLRGDDRDRAVRAHLHADADPAPAVRQGGDRLMAIDVARIDEGGADRAIPAPHAGRARASRR